MRHGSLLLLTLVLLLCAQPVFAQTGADATRQPASTPSISIQAPSGGQALQGLMIIQGSDDIAGFMSASIAFTYHGDPTGTWFLITESEIPVSDGALATWDTTLISDGDYDLRLMVKKNDGSLETIFVYGVRVRNYTPVETDTPAPPTPSTTPLPPTPGASGASGAALTLTSTPTLTPVPPTKTPLPTNPAELSQTVILSTLGSGGLIALGLFIVLGIYLAARALLRQPTRHKGD